VVVDANLFRQEENRMTPAAPAGAESDMAAFAYVAFAETEAESWTFGVEEAAATHLDSLAVVEGGMCSVGLRDAFVALEDEAVERMIVGCRSRVAAASTRGSEQEQELQKLVSMTGFGFASENGPASSVLVEVTVTGSGDFGFDIGYRR
jgi:hypothetical protein